MSDVDVMRRLPGVQPRRVSITQPVVSRYPHVGSSLDLQLATNKPSSHISMGSTTLTSSVHGSGGGELLPRMHGYHVTKDTDSPRSVGRRTRREQLPPNKVAVIARMDMGIRNYRKRLRTMQAHAAAAERQEEEEVVKIESLKVLREKLKQQQHHEHPEWPPGYVRHPTTCPLQLCMPKWASS